MNEGSQSPSRFNFKSEYIEGLLFIKNFIRRPVEHIRRVPDWNWQVLISVFISISIVLGAFDKAFNGLLSSSHRVKITSVISGMIVYPLGMIFVVGLMSALFYFSSLFIFQTKLNYKKVATVSFLACLPWVLMGPFVTLAPPIKPFAVIMSGFLAIVGFTENTHLNKKSVTRIVGAIVTVFLIFWVINMIRSFEQSPSKERLIDQQTLDILQKEMQETD